MSRRKYVQPCFGYNPRTGKPVGTRHRWPHGWGIGYCQWCHKTIEEVMEYEDDEPDSG